MSQDNPDNCQTGYQMSHWDGEYARTREALQELGLWREGQSPKPWLEALVRPLAHIRGTDRLLSDRAKLDIVLAVAIDDAIDRLVAASNDNTRTMSRLTRVMIALTAIYVATAAADVFLNWTAKPPVVHVAPAPVVVAAPSPPPAVTRAPNERPTSGKERK